MKGDPEIPLRDTSEDKRKWANRLSVCAPPEGLPPRARVDVLCYFAVQWWTRPSVAPRAARARYYSAEPEVLNWWVRELPRSSRVGTRWQQAVVADMWVDGSRNPKLEKFVLNVGTHLQ